ncbi:hypothetical protein [Bradyrhizobium sp. Ghvi]|uniref:hypothetical protein n=1 Tax=Bradyrhizobium sp. Ghvi TaxID=1855319 RepID=UPI0015A60AF1|nr:hypothetical protein [Bradyrhizobium sp. Ghvi]
MIDQPAVETRRQRSRRVADRAQQRKAERREHEGGRRQRVDRKHKRLAIGNTDTIHDALRQQQQRWIDFLELDRMLAGDPSRDREQPAREQVRIEDNRDQNRQREAETRHARQDKLPPPRQRQKIECGQHRTEYQLERHHEAEERRPRHPGDVMEIVGLSGTKQKGKCCGSQRGAENCEIARCQHPFEADERTEHGESLQAHVAQAARPADPRQQQAAEHGKDEKHAAMMMDEKAART